jgi:hypothetical protein
MAVIYIPRPRPGVLPATASAVRLVVRCELHLSELPVVRGALVNYLYFADLR